MKSIILLYGTLFVLTFSYSQVGIGTTSPSSELEIETTNAGIPALELNPQTSPIGTTEGQIAVINDKVFIYNTTRSKWLSMETVALQYGRSGNQDNVNMRAAGNVANNNSGIFMPLSGTIVYVTAKSNSNSGAQAKDLTIRVRNGTTDISTTTITTASSEYLNTSFDVDFSSGDYINATIDNDGNGNVNNVVLVLWVKWRE